MRTAGICYKWRTLIALLNPMCRQYTLPDFSERIFRLMRVYFTDEFRRQQSTFSAPRPGDAGYDLRALEAVALAPGSRTLIATGICVEIPAGCVGLIKDRSSMALAGLHTMAGVIDASYRGEIKVLLLNTGNLYQISSGQKIAQLIVVPCYSQPLEPVATLEALSASERGQAGFGSTGA